jgi:hypothetical protein
VHGEIQLKIKQRSSVLWLRSLQGFDADHHIFTDYGRERCKATVMYPPPPKKNNPKKPQQKQQLINISSILVITINDFTKVEKIIVRCHCPIFVYNRSPMINPRW